MCANIQNTNYTIAQRDSHELSPRIRVAQVLFVAHLLFLKKHFRMQALKRLSRKKTTNDTSLWCIRSATCFWYVPCGIKPCTYVASFKGSLELAPMFFGVCFVMHAPEPTSLVKAQTNDTHDPNGSTVRNGRPQSCWC